MANADFDPADVACWIAHGRKPKHAALIAAAWRDHPDLPPTAPLDERRARSRARIAAMNPVNEQIRRDAARAQEEKNFAFTEDQLRLGKASTQDAAILTGRDRHGYGWLRSVDYAWGWTAAQAGWEFRPPGRNLLGIVPAGSREAYAQGFADGGGRRDDLFDMARRQFAAAGRAPTPLRVPSVSPRPLPSVWPKPADIHVSVAWDRRLVILAASQERRAQLAALLDGAEIDDILVAAQGDYLTIIDAHAGVLPLCRVMERTRNTPLQQRAHGRTWLDRGRSAGENVGAGHIRWGKVIHGLTGKLGEFTARYGGKAAPRGHRILIETAPDIPAIGYVTAAGAVLAPEIVIPNKAHMRAEMARALRSFAAATRLAIAARSQAMTSDHTPDFFDPVAPAPHCRAVARAGADPLPTLAIPCGFRDRRNAACRRLGVRPVTIDGEWLRGPGWTFVHCESACFQGDAA